MLFFLHILTLIYGLTAILVGKFRTSGLLWDAGSSRLYQTVDTFFPDSIYKPYQTGTTVEQGLIPDLTRTYLIGGGLVAYSLRYLLKRHRG